MNMEEINENLENEGTEVHSEDSLKEYLSFQVGEEDFAVDITSVVEIKAWTKPTRLPNVPSYLLGIINVRGVILPIFDLRGRFGLGNTEADQKKVIVFITYQGRTIGILVDGVSDIVKVSEDEIQPAPNVEGDIKDEFINGLVGANGKMLVLLDIEKLFEGDELKKIDKVKSA